MRANIEQEIQDKIVEEYTQEATQAALSRKYGVSCYLIKKVLSKHNVRLHPAGNQTQRKYEVDDSFFDTQTHDMAYVLGLLASDGNVSKKENAINFVASSQDGEHLEKIRKLLQSSKPLAFYTDSKGNQSCRLSVHSKHFKEVLSTYNIVPAKTKIYTFSYKLQKEFWADYLRGYFDGDGSVSPCGSGAKWQLGAYNKEILEWIMNYLYEEFDIPKPIIYKYPNRHFFQLTYAEQTNVKKIYEVLYNGDRICLERKKLKFDSLIKK